MSTTPEIAECQRCRAMAVSATSAGVRVGCDPTPLTAEGEALCLLLGRRTYTWRHGHSLDHRGVIAISAGIHPDIDVVAEHYCGQSIPASMIDRPRLVRRHRPIEAVHEFGEYAGPPPF